MTNLENAIKNFYKTTNFYQFDKIQTLEIVEINNVKYVDAKVQVSRNGDKFTDKIFENIKSFEKFM